MFYNRLKTFLFISDVRNIWKQRMMIFDEGYTTVIISFKVLILILSGTVATINIKTHFQFEGLSAIFRSFENADLTVHVTSFAIMSSVVSGYGAILLYVENRPEFREAIQTAFRLYLVWDVALFLELSLTTVILYYCYTSADYIFQVRLFKLRPNAFWCSITTR